MSESTFHEQGLYTKEDFICIAHMRCTKSPSSEGVLPQLSAFVKRIFKRAICGRRLHLMLVGENSGCVDERFSQ